LAIILGLESGGHLAQQRPRPFIGRSDAIEPHGHDEVIEIRTAKHPAVAERSPASRAAELARGALGGVRAPTLAAALFFQ